jgi:hypothetical protein
MLGIIAAILIVLCLLGFLAFHVSSSMHDTDNHVLKALYVTKCSLLVMNEQRIRRSSHATRQN